MDLLTKVVFTLISVTIGELFYWTYKYTGISFLNTISQALTLAVILVFCYMLFDRLYRLLINQSLLSDKLYRFLGVYTALILIFSLVFNLKSVVTIFINSFALPPLVLTLSGYFIGKYIYFEDNLASVNLWIRRILWFSIGAFVIGMIVPMFSLAINNVLSRIMYIALLYFALPIERKDRTVLYVSVPVFVFSSFYADVRTNLIFLIAVGLYYFVRKFLPILLRGTNSIFIIGIFLSFLVIFNSESFFNALFSLSYFENSELSSSDTRTFIYQEFFKSYNSITEFLFGRGLMGTYFSEYFYNIYDTEYQGDFYYRFSNEVGVLHIILKCGLIYLIAYSGLIINTLFNSNKKAPATYVVYILFLLMFIEFFPAFSIRYLIFWVLIGYLSAGSSVENFNIRKSLAKIAYNEK